ncbi:MAG: FecR domain-containing protein [Verrucomicrobia bacterium]|nr:FecR domain-containing protein [Verrucomicrobiota bacterium]
MREQRTLQDDSMTDSERQLVDLYLDGVLPKSEHALLFQRLETDPEALVYLALRTQLNVDLRRSFKRRRLQQMAVAAAATSTVCQTRFHWLSWRPLAAAAACAALLVGGGLWWQIMLATVVNDAGVEELSNGAMLKGETHSLKGGSVELITSRGARIVIEAPAEFRFESAQRLRMMSGRLSAEVPPAAKGFTVVTPSGDAVDLGTRFGVDVPSNGAAEVHVFQGEVIAKALGDTNKQSLRGGDAVTMDGGASMARELRSSAFIQADEMSGLSAGLSAGQRARSEAALGALKSDPALIALLDFESGEAHPGVFRTVQGRWPGSHAAEFVKVGDHLKLDVGGGRAWPQLTLAAWVRLDRVGGERLQSLLHTDGWKRNEPGMIHWQVSKLGTMWLMIFPGLKGNATEAATPALPDQGRWTHLVSVFDAEKRSVRHYLNGVFGIEVPQPEAQPALLGPAQIGNWDQYDRKLSGRIDEMLLLGRAMSDADVRALFEAGNPYR